MLTESRASATSFGAAPETEQHFQTQDFSFLGELSGGKPAFVFRDSAERGLEVAQNHAMLSGLQ